MCHWHRKLLAASALGLGLSGAVVAHAQSTSSATSQYPGVVPGTSNPPPRVNAAKSERNRLLTWPGFQMLPDGQSRVFVQTSKPVQTETRVEQGRFVLILKNTRIHLENNQRPLETRYFNTPVNRVRLERRGKDLAVVMELRSEVQPTKRDEAGADGFHYTFVDFPAGSYAVSLP